MRKILKKFYLKKSTEEFTLDNIIDYATSNVKYYKKYKGCKIEEFPFLTKELIKNNFEELTSDKLEHGNIYINTSGGSTGEPVRLIQNQTFKEHTRYVTYEQKGWAGYRFADPMIKLWGNEKEILGGSNIKGRLINYLKNIKTLNSFTMTESKMLNYISQINDFKPKLLVSYVQAIYELAKFTKENDIKANPIPSIMTSAGTLHPFMKVMIEEVFQTKVYNRYGSREIGPIASTTKDIDELKISTNNVYIEIIDEDGQLVEDGIEGNIAITLLSNHTMPLIRYKIGDRGILNKKKYSYPILEKVTGRVTDVFRTSNGKIIPAEYFIHIIGVVFNSQNNWIKKFQIIQKEYEYIIIKIVKLKEHTSHDLLIIEDSIKKVMGEECIIKFDFVDEIKSLSNGKYRYTISNIDN